MSAKNYLCPFCENRYYGVHELNRHIEDEHNAPILTDQQILEKALTKAFDNGWNPKSPEIKGTFNGTEEDYIVSLAPLYIFNRDFAKSLWGEYEPMEVKAPEGVSSSLIVTKEAKKGWDFHLQQMVIADDPIKYLGENI